jgi:hypothetical protein
VLSDPRVTGSGASWTCTGAALPIGNGANTGICPSFPAAIIPGSVCGHSGPTGSGFVVIKGTATGIDPYLNNSFITTAGNVDAVLPGPTNLECTPFTGQIPLIAWGTRSDLATVEGTIAEDTNGSYGLSLGQGAGFLTELTGGCDTSTSGSRELSIFAIGVGLSNTSPTYVYNLQDQKFGALTQTLNADPPSGNVYYQLLSYINNAETYVTTAQNDSTHFSSNINCALNQIATADSYLRGYLPAFSSNLVTTGSGGGNPNPAGEIDGRLANWYTVLNTMLAGNQPYVSWPLPPASVPACPLSMQPQITGYTDYPSGGNENVDWSSINTNTCTLTSLYAFNYADTGYNFESNPVPTGAPNSNPPFGGDNVYYIIPGTEGEGTAIPQFATPGWGTDTYTLTCYGAPDDNYISHPATVSILNTSGFTASTPTPLTIATFTTDGNGDLGWTTANSNPSTTTCTITDEYGGPPYYQSPIGPLPANNPLTESEGEGSFPTGAPYPYFYGEGAPAFCGDSDSPIVLTDTITLTCSDKYNGTAFSTLTLYNPCLDSE